MNMDGGPDLLLYSYETCSITNNQEEAFLQEIYSEVEEKSLLRPGGVSFCFRNVK